MYFLSRSISSSKNGGNRDNGPDKSINRSILDLVLMQSNCSSCNGACVEVPRTEAFALWKMVDPYIVMTMEALHLPRQTINPALDIALQSAINASIESKSDLETTPAPTETKDANKDEKAFKHIGTSGKSLFIRSSQPNESALFARVKSTMQGGSWKKPKFRLSPA